MGNALQQREDSSIRVALQQRCEHPDINVRQHVAWAMAQVPGQGGPQATA